MTKKVVVKDPEIIGMGRDSSKNPSYDPTLPPVPELIEEDTADRDLGREAGLAGRPNDDTKSEARQRGAESKK